MTGAAPGDSPGAAAQDTSVPAAEGRLVAGQYRLLRQLGRGGMGVVWLALDEFLDREVAVKELRPPSYLAEESSAELRERAMREARNAARIRHPNAVTLYHVIPPNAGDDAVYLIMEFVDGPTLAELIESHGSLPAPWVGTLGLQLLDVLQAAHALGIVHRDVKPANILVTNEGRAKLADFGIAHSATDPRLTGIGVVGTPAYVAPELFNRGPLTPAVDLWSLGATLYHAADGHTPFDRDSLDALIYAIVLDPALPVPDCDPGIAAAIGAMLCRDPSQRATIPQARVLLSPYEAPRLPPLEPPPQSPPGAGEPQAAAVDPAPGDASVISVNSAPPPSAGAPAADIPPSAGPTERPAARRPPGTRLRRIRLLAAVAAFVVIVAVGVTVGVLAMRAPGLSGRGAARQYGPTASVAPSTSAGSTPGGSSPSPSLAATSRSSPTTSSSVPASSSGSAPAQSSGSPQASASQPVPVRGSSSAPAPGSSSTPATSQVPPPAPAITGVSLDESDGDLIVTWGALADSGLSYYLHYEDLSSAQPAWKSALTATTTSTLPGCTPTKAQAGVCTLTTAKLPGLAVGDTFAIYVTAANAAGQGKASATHYYVGAPADFTAANNNGVVDLSWVAVSGNSVVIYYLDETATDGTWQTVDCAETTTTCKFSYPTDSTQVADLTIGDRYDFYAESDNKYGAGDSPDVTVTPAA